MPEFIIAYRGGDHPSSKEEGAAHMAKWHAWVKGMGEDAVNPGTPWANPASSALTAFRRGAAMRR